MPKNGSAKDKATNKDNSITITGGTNLSEDQIKNMMGDFNENKSADEAKHKIAEAIHSLESSIYASEKFGIRQMSAQRGPNLDPARPDFEANFG